MLEKAKELGLINDHNEKLLYPLDIQLFGDSDEDQEGGDGADDSSSENDEEDETGDDDQEQETFTQDAVDKIVQKRIARERKKWEQEHQEEQTEAEKLAGMSEKQKKEYTARKKSESLEEREREITKRELSATAKETLADRELPTELADVLDYTDAEACNASIDKIEKAFQKAVQKAIDDKIKGGEVIKKANSNASKTQEEEIYKTMMGK